LISLGVQLYASDPPRAGFDLELLLRAGRDVAAGHSPYDPALVAGAAPVAERLFYSYPPAVAQFMAIFAAIPSPVMFVAWTAAAVGGLGLVARSLAIRFGSMMSPTVFAAMVIAAVPLTFPFAIGLLFGNLDVFFPLAFGLVLVGVLSPTSNRAASSGAATGLAAVAKLHPASVGVWLIARSPSTPDARRMVIAAIVVVLGVVGLSVAVGGFQPWLDYASVVRAGSGAELVDARNGGPAAQLALTLGGGGAGAEALARTLQIPVTIVALVATVAVALRVHEPVESLAWAVALSLIVLPVTWYHYPSALIPFAIAALLRSPRGGQAANRVRWSIAAAAFVAAVAIAWLPLIYVAIGLVLAAVRISGHPEARLTGPATRGTG
jgi:hypothetical protein